MENAAFGDSESRTIQFLVPRVRVVASSQHNIHTLSLSVYACLSLLPSIFSPRLFSNQHLQDTSEQLFDSYSSMLSSIFRMWSARSL